MNINFQKYSYSARPWIFLIDEERDNMEYDKKLELQLEILILENNIQQFARLGCSTESLQNRLDLCNSQLSEIKQPSNKSFSLPNVKQLHNQPHG
jgi:hypothetical protein